MSEVETKELLVFGAKTFKIKVPVTAKITFGPFSPPTPTGYGNQRRGGYDTERAGTLRIYESAKKDANIIGVFSGVVGFRDLSLEYMEEIVREGGTTIWRSDEHGFVQENKQHGKKVWVDPSQAAIESGETVDGEAVEEPGEGPVF